MYKRQPLSVYDNLIAAVHEALPSLTDYLKLRRERMGLSELHMYDMYAPLVDNFDMDLPYPCLLYTSLGARSSCHWM